MPGSDTLWLTFSIGGVTDAISLTPDIEAAIAAHLRTAAITGLGERVYSELPATPVYPLATIARIGGIPAVRQRLDAPNIQIDVWADTKDQAFDLAAICRAEILALEGETLILPSFVFVTGVDDALGMVWLPDDLTGRARYLFAMTIYAHG